MITELLLEAGPALDLWCQSLLWAGCCLLVGRAWRGASAARRQFVWTLALSGLLMLPLLTGQLPTWSLWTPAATDAAGRGRDGGAEVAVAATPTTRPDGPAATEPSGDGRPPAATPDAGRPVPPQGTDPGRPAATNEPVDRASQPGPVATQPPASPTWSRPRPATLLLLVWAAGGLAVLAPLVLGRLLIRRWLDGARPAPAAEVAAAAAELGLTRVPPVLVGPRIPAPATCGLVRPRVLLPRAWAAWPAARRRLVLLHELAHVQRGDAAALTVGRLGLAAAWWQPLAWHLHGALRRDTEQACDDRVVAAEADGGVDYARCLVDVARESRAPRRLAGLAMARAGDLEQRLTALLDEARPRRRVSPRLRGSGMGLAAAVLLVCAGLDVLAPPLAAGSPAPVPGPLAPRAAGAELVVERDGSGTHPSLAAALAAAEPGDVIRLGEGVFEGVQRVEVPVTLRGAGAGRTVLRTPWAVDEALAKDLEARFLEADEAGREALRREARDLGTPVVLDLRAPGITVEALTVSHPGDERSGGIRQGAAVRVRAADTTLRQLAVVHTLGSGVVVEDDASLLMEDCLVARSRATGVAIGPGQGAVVLRRCDIRDGYHRGVTIGRDDVLVEGCRISGSAWHAIRYDGCSPTIRGNALFANERFGIYASGTTAATVEGNLFLENGMAGMSCWYRNADTIRGNTFVGDARAALEVLGNSRPTVRANVFAWTPVAVRAGTISGNSGDARAAGLPDLGGNLVFGCGDPVAAPDLEQTPAADALGLLVADPGFADAEQRDFRLVAEGAARAAGAGVAAPIDLASPWPVQPGERADAPGLTAGPLDTAPLAPAPEVSPQEQGQAWAQALTGDDDGARFRALQAVRSSLLSDDDGVAQAGLIALQGSYEADFERASLRPHVEALARRLRGAGRVSAFYVLNLLGRTEGDKALLFEALAEPDEALARSASHLLAVHHELDLRDPACEAVLLRLLEGGRASDLREVFRGTWGARLSGPVVARVLEHSRTALAHDAVYFCLSTLPEKSDAVVDRLLEELEPPPSDSLSRALWGLRVGLSPGQQDVARQALVAALDRDYGVERLTRGVHLETLDALGWLGDDGTLERLEALAAAPGSDEQLATAARLAAERLRDRLGLPRHD